MFGESVYGASHSREHDKTDGSYSFSYRWEPVFFFAVWSFLLLGRLKTSQADR